MTWLIILQHSLHWWISDKSRDTNDANTHQQERSVDVNVFKDSELFLGLHGQKPRPVQLSLHPIAHTAMLSFERGSQRSACPWHREHMNKNYNIYFKWFFLFGAYLTDTHVCGSSKLNAYSCLPEWIVVSASSELSSSETEENDIPNIPYLPNHWSSSCLLHYLIYSNTYTSAKFINGNILIKQQLIDSHTPQQIMICINIILYPWIMSVSSQVWWLHFMHRCIQFPYSFWMGERTTHKIHCSSRET